MFTGQTHNVFAFTCDELFPKGALTNPNYGKIINDQHFDRLVSMLDMGKIIYGGQYNKETLKIAPTIIDQARLDSPLMKEEIFGPLLPLFNFESLDDVFALIRRRHRPLALCISYPQMLIIIPSLDKKR